jgi:hypothetical protein
MVAAWIDASVLADLTTDAALAQEAVDAASYALFMLSGRKYTGVQQTTETYCQIGLDQTGVTIYGRHILLPGPSGYQIYPELMNGMIYNRIGGCCSQCGCEHLIRLRGAPVLSIQSVYRGSDQVLLSDVAIYDYSYISALDRCWFTCDDLTVTYTFGAPPPAMGRIAAQALAEQYVLAMTNSDECALPQRVTQISRQGVSWTLLDPQDFLDKGRTGIYQVDLFLTTVNPDGARLRSRVFSPDLHRGKTRRPQVRPVQLGAPAQYGYPAPSVAMTQTMTAPAAPGTGTVTVYEGRPLRWVVPGSFDADHPPVITVQPSGREVPPTALLWRTSNYTLDLTAEEAADLLPPGSALVVSTQDDQGGTTGGAQYPVERRTL